MFLVCSPSPRERNPLTVLHLVDLVHTVGDVDQKRDYRIH
jgi:hypothetical protein